MADDLIALVREKVIQARKVGRLVVFTVATTSKKEPHPYLTPLREFPAFTVLGCVLFDQKTLIDVLTTIDGTVDVILVDAEKKIGLQSGMAALHPEESKTIGNFETGNLSKLGFSHIKRSRIFEYKPNDITVNAAWMFLSQRLKSFTGKKVAILGLGNIGAKLALKIVECGAEVHVSGRDFYKTHLVTQALNLIKPKGTIASITCHREALPATFSSDAVIGATDGFPIINEDVVLSVKPGCLIIDLGKNNISESALIVARQYELEVCRTDVTSSLEAFVTEVLNVSKNQASNYGTIDVAGYAVVGGGYFGAEGAIIVDSIVEPRVIFGVCDGRGSVKKEVTHADTVAMSIVREALGLGHADD